MLYPEIPMSIQRNVLKGCSKKECKKKLLLPRKYKYLNTMKKTMLLGILCFCLSFASIGQWTYVEIGVNGLTCSMCTRSVDNALQKLDFIDQVEIDLESTNGRIYFKPNAKPDVDAIRQAVVDAGFSLRFLKVKFQFKTPMALEPEECFILDGTHYQMINAVEVETKEAVFQLIGKGFMPKSAYKKWRSKLGKICWREDVEPGYYLFKE